MTIENPSRVDQMTIPGDPQRTVSRGRGWLALVSMSLVLVAIGLDLTVLNVALPSLAVDLDASSTDLQWFINAYALVMATTLLPAGRIGDRVGPRKLILAAVVMFSIASALCAFAPSSGWLIVGRAFLGASAGVFMPLSMSMLTRMFEGAARSRAISVWTAAVALGIPVGPLLGGWLLDHFWWGSVFLINVPLAAVAAVALFVTLPAVQGSRNARIDSVGIVLASLMLLALTFGFTRAGDEGWVEAWTLLPIAVGCAAAVVFGLWLRRTAHPLFSLRIFDTPQFLWGSVMATVASLVMMTTIFIVPQFAQLAYDTDSFGLGLRLLPFIGGLIFAVPIAGVGIKQFGYKAVVATGFLIMVAANVMATTTTIDSPQWFFVLWSALAGGSVGLTLPNSMDLAMSVMNAEESGVGSGIVQSMRQLGGTLGVAVLGSVLVSTYRDRLDLTGLPQEVVDAVHSSPSLGTVVARSSHDQLPSLLDTVQQSFLAGMGHSFWGLAGIASIAGVLAIWKVPTKPGSEVVEGSGGVF